MWYDTATASAATAGLSRFSSASTTTTRSLPCQSSTSSIRWEIFNKYFTPISRVIYHFEKRRGGKNKCQGHSLSSRIYYWHIWPHIWLFFTPAPCEFSAHLRVRGRPHALAARNLYMGARILLGYVSLLPCAMLHCAFLNGDDFLLLRIDDFFFLFLSLFPFGICPIHPN